MSSICKHGVNTKHQHCYDCEDIAVAEGKAYLKAQQEIIDRHDKGTTKRIIQTSKQLKIILDKKMTVAKPIKDDKGLRWLKMESSSIAQVRYDRSKKELDVMFNNESLKYYRYKNITPEKFIDMLFDPESAGKFHAREIRAHADDYPYTIITAGIEED